MLGKILGYTTPIVGSRPPSNVQALCSDRRWLRQHAVVAHKRHRFNGDDVRQYSGIGSFGRPTLCRDHALDRFDHLIEHVGFMQEMIDSGTVDLCLQIRLQIAASDNNFHIRIVIFDLKQHIAT
jgi:hypothetical protein